MSVTEEPEPVANGDSKEAAKVPEPTHPWADEEVEADTDEEFIDPEANNDAADPTAEEATASFPTSDPPKAGGDKADKPGAPKKPEEPFYEFDEEFTYVDYIAKTYQAANHGPV